jgi:YD repeat-containing protein
LYGTITSACKRPSCKPAFNIKHQNAVVHRGGGANAVKSVTLNTGATRSYGYDASGNLISDNAGFSARYDHANLATKLQRNTLSNFFTYGANNQKAKQTGTDGTKAYVGGYEDWVTAAQTKVTKIRCVKKRTLQILQKTRHRVRIFAHRCMEPSPRRVNLLPANPLLISHTKTPSFTAAAVPMP